MQKSRFDQRRSAQGYRNPSEREGCRNCRHRSREANSQNAGTYDCRLGGFIVALNGICDEHQLTGIAALPRKDEP